MAKFKAKYSVKAQAINTGSVVITGSKFGAVEDPAQSDATSSDDEDAPSSGEVNWGTIFFLTWSATFREGLETLIFLGAVGTGLDPVGTVIGGLVGILLGIIFGWVVFWIGKQIGDIRHFFTAMTMLILIIASGLSMYGTHEFEELGSTYAKSTNHPVILRPLWDISACCPDSDGPGAVFRALVGYQDKPTLAEATVYLSYWMFAVGLITWRYKNGVLFMGKKGRSQLARQQGGLQGKSPESEGKASDAAYPEVYAGQPYSVMMAPANTPYWGTSGPMYPGMQLPHMPVMVPMQTMQPQQ
mmetsp:Transcript_37308/g.84980  ORF Transcript_37308/g.84980 Transcript_37308/m.84980 type:complete len:300 (-) Transcript_37308:101-1000(-)